MKKRFFTITILITLLSLLSCNNDDNGFEGIPTRDRGPQNILDESFLKAFLENYTYNDKIFEDNAVLGHENIEFIRIKDTLGNSIALTSEQKEKSTEGKSLNDFARSVSVNQFGQNYKLYYVVVRQGTGKEVALSDDIFTSFKGSVIGTPGALTQENAEISISEQSFVESNNPFWFRGFNFQVTQDQRTILVRNENNRNEGFSVLQSKFKTAPPLDVNQPCKVSTSDALGDTNFSNFGVGILIIPSGMAFYRDIISTTPVGEYSNLVYTFSLINNDLNDLDNDGIPDLNERINENIVVDTDGDGIENYLDPDDDGDGRVTRNEVELTDLNATTDYDCDGVVDNDLQLVTPLRDDNGNTIPNYLDRSE